MSTETILTNARVILAEEIVEGTVAFADGRITDVSSGRSGVPAALDLEGDCLAPGFVELHTDNIERHLTPRPNTYWPADAAVMSHDREVAATGITTVFNALSIGHADPGSRDIERLREACAAIERSKANGQLKADHYLHLRCELSCGELMQLVEPLMERPLAQLVSLMDHTPGQRQYVSMEKYRAFYQSRYRLSEAELEEFAEARVADQQRYSTDNRSRVAKAAKARGIRIASHDDATVGHVEEAVADGVTIAEFPTTEEAARASHEAGLGVLMGGPNIVRGQSHNGNASARDFAAEGWLDIVSSDYVPSSLLHAALILNDKIETITLPRAIGMITAAPARYAGFDDRGAVAQGLRADLVRFRPTDGAPVIREVWREGRRVA